MDNQYSDPLPRYPESALVENILSPDLNSQIAIQSRAEAATQMCWTCGSCDSECPVNIATGRLRPQRIVRLASLGLMDELLRSPEIWYCISCRRCFEVCPNLVKPSTIIAFTRYAMVANRVLSIEKVTAYRELFAQFQRVRWYAAAKCMQGEFDPISEKTFKDWLRTPVAHASDVIPINQIMRRSVDFRSAIYNFNISVCFSCGECSSACPVSCERSIFDARTIFRMANLGLKDLLLNSPSLWLCISCGRCSDACSQLVDGRNLIGDLQQMAVERGTVDSGFRFRLQEANKIIYAYLLAQIDSVLSFA